MKYHRTVSMMDYVLITARAKTLSQAQRASTLDVIGSGSNNNKDKSHTPNTHTITPNTHTLIRKGLVTSDSARQDDQAIWDYISGNNANGISVNNNANTHHTHTNPNSNNPNNPNNPHYNYTGQYLNIMCHALLQDILKYNTIGDFKLKQCE